MADVQVSKQWTAGTGQPASLQPIKQVRAGVLEIGYYEVGASDGLPVLPLRGWPYDIHSYVEVALMLAARGCRVIVPTCGATERRASWTVPHPDPVSRHPSLPT